MGAPTSLASYSVTSRESSASARTEAVHGSNVVLARGRGSAPLRRALWRAFDHSGLTQVEFAEGVIGISVDTFSRWVDGKTQIRTEVVLESRVGALFAGFLAEELQQFKEAA